MRRVVVFALVGVLGQSPVAMAGETLLESASRVVREVVARETARPGPTALPARRLAPAPLKAAQQQPGLAEAGMRTRNKLLIALGIGAAFAGIALAIDSRVEDSTPSTLGTRED